MTDDETKRPAPAPREPGAPQQKPRPSSPDEALPPVQAPNAGFILQLFLIPMIIVTIIVVVCLLFSWLAHMGANPQDLVRDLRRLNEGSWQKAFTLSNLLRDRKHEYLKYDVQLADELADILQAEMADGSMDDSRILLRVYLCRALGEFRVQEPLDALIEAATTERDSKELDVRYAAIEAIALMTQNVEVDKLKLRDKLLQALLVTSTERTNNQDLIHKKGELRSAAAFALGVFGGTQADDRLARMLDDSHPNARYNAATGLARRGDPRCVRVLLEMLDPANEEMVKGETSESQRERKRNLVIMNGIRAAGLLREANTDAQLDELEQQLRGVQSGELPRPLRIKAKETLAEFEQS